MQITVLAGGVGGARFIRGLRHHLDHHGRAWNPDTGEGTHVTVIGNTGDDITLFGLRVCPDVDTLLYTLGGSVDEGQGWGRDDETFRAQSELRALGVEPQWFGLGDHDMGTHLARSQWLAQGWTLSEVTARLAHRWGLPPRGITLLPATDVPIETHVVIADDTEDDGSDTPTHTGKDIDAERAVHFQQWWVQMRAAVPAKRFVVAGLSQATAAPGVLAAIREADVVLLPPSNPVVSIGIIIGVPGVRDALRGTRAPVVGVSPIIAGAPVRGHADACLAPLGVPVTAAGVAGLYRDFLNGWLVDTEDAPSSGDAAHSGLAYGRGASGAPLSVQARDLHMRDVESAAAIAGASLDLAASVNVSS